MNRFRELIETTWRALQEAWQRATGGSVVRQRVFAGGAALLLLLIVGSLVLTSMAGGAAPQRVVARAQPTATSTATATATATLAPTATAKPKPLPTPKPVAKTPPPPPVPAPPASTPSASGSNAVFSTFCPTPTPAPPTPTATATPTNPGSSSGGPAPTATAAPTAYHTGMAMPAACNSCPYYSGNNPSTSAIASALATAANKYNLPVNLVKAVAWQESKWHEDAYSCDGGIGLMQVQYYVYDWLNQQDHPACYSAYNIHASSDDPYTLQGNADLGAKYLAYLACYYSFWGGYDYDINGNPHSLTNPTKYTAAWYYQQAALPYPDGSNPSGLCATDFTSNPYNFKYGGLPASQANEVWSCPYNATATDNTLLDLIVSAYNEGPGNVDKYGINNTWYIAGVYSFVPVFASGSMPA